MATERARRRLALAGLAAAAAALLGPPLGAAAQAPGPTRTPQAQATQPPASEPWWVPVGFRGNQVGSVRVDGGVLAVDVGGAGQQQSRDGGTTWQGIFERHGLAALAPGEWAVCDGREGRRDPTGACSVDPGSPRLAASPTAGHASIAAIPGNPGVVVAVDVDGVVWSRDPQGHWSRGLLLLNQDALHGPPRITGVASFDAPLSTALYLATDGYSVLESTDAGVDWVRANPGLPDSVLAIATDSSRRAVYAGTGDGLWVHHLQATPAPPVYAPQDLTWRWLATAAVCVAAAAAGIGGMIRLMR